MKKYEDADKNNSYTNFWNFVSITLIFLGLNDFLMDIVHSIVFTAIIQFVAIVLMYQYVNPHLGKVTKSICIKTKIPIGVFTFIYFILFVFIRVIVS